MMDRLREGVNSIAVKIILGLIILSFIFAGIGSYLVSGSNNAAAKVGNTEIDRTQFEQAYQNERNRMQSQMGDYFSNLLADPAYVASFRRSILDRMINDVLIEQHADSLGLKISDAQVRKIILDMPQFQSDGKFDQEIYQSALRRAGFTADSFADYMRRDLLRSQVTSALQGSEFTLKGEIDAQSALVAQTRDIRKITLPLDEFAKKVSLTDEEIQTYYKEHSESYTRPAQAKVSYIELSAEQLAKQITVSDDEAEKYYQDHIDTYSSAEQREVSHILIQGDDEAKAQKILDELKGGADFATLAKEKSEDAGSAENGGSLGWIEHDTMDPAFEKAAFGLAAVGDMTGLVKSQFGYHIIKLDALKAPKAKPFKDVEADIKTELASQKAVDKFYDLQTKLEKVAYESPDSLEEAAKVISAKVITTDFISEKDAPQVLQSSEVQQAIQSPEVMEDGLNSSAIEVAPEHVIVVRVEDKRPETVLPLEEVKDQVVASLSNSKGEEQVLDLSKQIIDGLNKGDKSLLEKNNLSFGDLELIDRSSPLAQTVFAMPKPEKDKVVYGQAKDQNGNVVIVELDKVEAKVEPQYEKQIGAQLTRMSTQQDLQGVISVLRKNTDIEYYAVNQ